MTPRKSKPIALLEKAVAECKQVFEVKSLESSQQSADRHYSHEIKVRAYLVAIHAAFEEYFESVAEDLADLALKNWVGKTRRSTPACALLMFYFERPSDMKEMESRFTERGRRSLEEAVAAHKHVIGANNGINIDHLQRLFFPLGIDLPDDPRLVTAITELKIVRGDAAHRHRRKLSDTKGIKEWNGVVDECLEFARKVASQADAVDWG